MQRTDSPIGAYSSANGVTELLDQTVETAHLAGDLKGGPRGDGTDGTESFRTSAHGLSLPLLAQQSALPLVQTQLAQVKATGHEQSRDGDKQDDAYPQDGFHDVEVVDRESKEDNNEAGPSGRSSVDDGVGIAVGRRTVSIKPKDWAGGVVWAKLAKYPWWPAQVLDETDPWIPNDAEVPRHGAIPVRFFGTYDFAWIESQRAICPFDHDYDEHTSKIKQKAFLDALAEAKHFQKTQELPEGFNEESTPSPQKAPRKSRSAAGKGRGKKDGFGASGRGSKRGGDDSASHKRSVRERQESILQQLALVPPAESPFSHSICLDGVRKLMELQKAGQCPPPAAPVQQSFAQPHAFLPQFSGAQFLQPGQALQSQQLQHLQQQLQQAGLSRPQWPLHFQAFAPQMPLSFFQGQGGVQGALLAAANQNQFQPKQF